MFSSHSRSNTPKKENNKNQSNLPHDGVKYIDYNEKVQKILNELLDNFPDISVILLSTSEGVPLLHSLNPRVPIDHLPLDILHTKGATIFSSAAEMGGKMGIGECRNMLSMYANFTIMYINLFPFVVTVVTEDVGANLGLISTLIERKLALPLHVMAKAIEGIAEEEA